MRTQGGHHVKMNTELSDGSTNEIATQPPETKQKPWRDSSSQLSEENNPVDT